MEGVVGSDNYKREYVVELVKDWNSQLCMSSTITDSQSQVVYSAFVNGFKNKFIHMKTTPDISNSLLPMEDTTRNYFALAITSGRIYNEEERKLFTLPLDMGISNSIFHEQTEVEYNNSRRITIELTRLITRQHMENTVEELTTKKLSKKTKKKKNHIQEKRPLQLISNLPTTLLKNLKLTSNMAMWK